MLENISYLRATCDHCGNIEGVQNKQELIEKEWEEYNGVLWCDDCSIMFNDVKDELEVEGYVICLIDDESRHLVKDEEYQVNELIFLSSYAKDDAKNGLSIYVDVGNGWQARLNKGEYLLV